MAHSVVRLVGCGLYIVNALCSAQYIHQNSNSSQFTRPVTRNVHYSHTNYGTINNQLIAFCHVFTVQVSGYLKIYL